MAEENGGCGMEMFLLMGEEGSPEYQGAYKDHARFAAESVPDRVIDTPNYEGMAFAGLGCRRCDGWLAPDLSSSIGPFNLCYAGH